MDLRVPKVGKEDLRVPPPGTRRVRHGDHEDEIRHGEMRHYPNPDSEEWEMHGVVTPQVIQEGFREGFPEKETEVKADSDDSDGSDDSEDYENVLRRYHLDWDRINFHRQINQTRYLLMIALTFGFMITELIVGYLSRSVSLQADAFHMLSDVAALTIGFYSLQMSQRPRTERSTFGFLRAEVVGAIVNSVVLLTSCFFLTIEAVHKIIAVFQEDTGELLTEPRHVLIVGSIGLGINLVGLFLFHHHDGNLNDHAVFLHILGDLLGSVAVVISALVIEFGKGQFRYLTDPLASLLIITLLARMAYRLARDAIRIVLHLVPLETEPEALREALLELPQVDSIHSLHVWSLDQKTPVASLHLATSGDPYEAIDATKKVFHRFKIHYTTIQPESTSRHHQGREACADLVCHESSCLESELHRVRRTGLEESLV